MKNFGQHIKRLRESKNLTQKQVAKEIGVSERAYQGYEGGGEAKPSFYSLIALADCFDVSIDYLVGRSDDPKRH